MASRNYQDLIAWQKAMDLAIHVYEATSSFPTEERYGLTSQLRRAAVSIPSNIAEGQGRGTTLDFRRLLRIAHGSLREMETQIILADRLGFLEKRTGEKVLSSAGEVGRLVTGLANSLERPGKRT
jgi:four helix bundle protein